MSDANASTGAAATGEEQIFVVDDEPMLLEMACVILEPLGYRIRTFRDPQAALDAFLSAKPRPALVITDYSMHRMTGLDLINACRRAQPKQKILMISGTVGPEILRHASSKPDQFLAKPYHSKLLVDTVKTLLT